MRFDRPQRGARHSNRGRGISTGLFARRQRGRISRGPRYPQGRTISHRSSRELCCSAEKNYSYADGDQYYQWSPDSKWLLVQYGLPDRVQTPEVGLVAADGKSEVRNLTQSGYDDFQPKWSMDGKMMIWGSDREGALSQGGGAVSGDVFAMYFTKAFYDRSKLSKEELALVKEQEDKDKKEADEKAKAVRSEAPRRRASPSPDAEQGHCVRLGRSDGPQDASYDQHIGRQRLGTLKGRRKALLPDQL